MFSPRFEYKYRIVAAQTERIRQVAGVFMTPDVHSIDGCYWVNSLYFDTASFDDAHETDEGIVLRSKVRLRCYDRAPRPPFFLELKQRFGSTITKSRVDLSHRDARRLLGGEAPVDAYRTGRSHAGLDKIRQVIDSRDMRPRIWVNYSREAFTSPWADGARVTFDSAVETQAVNPAIPLRPEPEGWTFPELDDRTVLELKFLGSAPQWMQRLTHELALDRVSVSKYGLGAFAHDRSPVIACPVSET